MISGIKGKEQLSTWDYLRLLLTSALLNHFRIILWMNLLRLRGAAWTQPQQHDMTFTLVFTGSVTYLFHCETSYMFSRQQIYLHYLQAPPLMTTRDMNQRRQKWEKDTTEPTLYTTRSLKCSFFKLYSTVSVPVIRSSCYLQSKIRSGYICKWSEVILVLWLSWALLFNVETLSW